MAAVDEVTRALKEIEPDLSRPAESAVESFALQDRIRALRKLIAEHGDRWISVAKAKRFLQFSSEKAIEYRVERGLFRSRMSDAGRIQVSLDDVLSERESYEAISAIDDGAPITPEVAMHLLRPLEYPRPPGFPESIRRPKRAGA
jgi:hypothetical protein